MFAYLQIARRNFEIAQIYKSHATSTPPPPPSPPNEINILELLCHLGREHRQARLCSCHPLRWKRDQYDSLLGSWNIIRMKSKWTEDADYINGHEIRELTETSDSIVTFGSSRLPGFILDREVRSNFGEESLKPKTLLDLTCVCLLLCVAV